MNCFGAAQDVAVDGMAMDVLPEDADRQFYLRAPWKRIIVMFAGPTRSLGKSFIAANFAAVMASSGKRKTTMAKLNRERRLLERRLEKKAKKDARKRASAHDPGRLRTIVSILALSDPATMENAGHRDRGRHVPPRPVARTARGRAPAPGRRHRADRLGRAAELDATPRQRRSSSDLTLRTEDSRCASVAARGRRPPPRRCRPTSGSRRVSARGASRRPLPRRPNGAP